LQELITDSQFITVLVTALVVGLVVVFHYEVIQQLNRWCPSHPSKNQKHRHRPIILATMFALLFAHIIEIWLFGVAFWGLLSQTWYGSISGYEHISLLDSVYFSAATYTTVGWGDLAATGHIRFLAGTEALVGFMMITWSASFSYLIMARAWGNESD
jgi:hypothetical protein